jgi:spore coat protein A, manganese oxidase
MRVSRGEFLRLGLVGAAMLALPFGACASLGDAPMGNLLRGKTRLPKPFGVPLPVPPVLEPARSDANVDYEIAQKTGTADMLPRLKTEVWGYEGIFPGPTIESRSGRKTVIRQTNELPVPVSTHLHGGRTPSDSDGYPTDLIVPREAAHRTGDEHGSMGASGMGSGRGFKDYSYPLEQRAMTLWYHDHRMDFTGP